MSAARVPATDSRLAVRLNRGATWHRVDTSCSTQTHVATACGITEHFDRFVISANGDYDCRHCARVERRAALRVLPGGRP